MRTAILFLAAAFLVAVVACRVSGEEGEARRNLPIPIPEDVVVDDATFQRLAAKYAEEKTREEARNELIAIGKPAVDALRQIANRGTSEQKRSAEVILLQIVGPPDQQPVPRGWDLEYGRISRWFEEHRPRLVWNEMAGRYE